MNSIVSDIYNGKLDPIKAYTGKDKEKYAEIMNAITNNEEKLASLLSEIDLIVLKQFADSNNDLTGFSSEEKFVLGFKIGAKVMLEVMQN